MNKIVQMLLTLTIIGVISGGALAMVNGWADPLIEYNRKKATEEAIFRVLPDAKTYEPVAGVPYELYETFDDTKNSTGYALIYQGSGFSAAIRLMIGVKPDLQTITALEILEQTETPGLGTKILEDEWRAQFKDLPADPKVDWVKGVEPSKPNEIQAITGATISSRAVVDIINAGMSELRAEKGGAQ